MSAEEVGDPVQVAADPITPVDVACPDEGRRLSGLFESLVDIADACVLV
jgi:hypothetical protein